MEVYKATDRRCYDGALSSDLKKEKYAVEKLEKRLKKLEPQAVCTYYPMECLYIVWVVYDQITEGHVDKADALIAAIEILEDN